jgi:hypothetical protein
MDTAATKPPANAKIRYEQQIDALGLGCKCSICMPETQEDNVEMLCHVILVETILVLGFVMSEVVVEEICFLNKLE